MIQLIQKTATQTFWVHLNGIEDLSVPYTTLTFENQLSHEVNVISPSTSTGNGRANTITFNFTEADIDNLPEGTYILTVKDDEATYATRLCYIRSIKGVMGENDWASYTTGDNTPDTVYYD